MSKLLHALRQKFHSPQAACEALGLSAELLPPEARYALAADASFVTDKATGETYDLATFARALWSTKEDPMYTALQRGLARDQAPGPTSKLPSQMRLPNDQDDPTNGGAVAPPDPDEIVQLLRILLAKAPDPQALLEALAAFVSEAGSNPGGAGADQSSLQDTPGAGTDLPKNTAADRRAGARDRRTAQDSNVRALNSSGFAKRFPDAAKVDAWR